MIRLVVTTTENIDVFLTHEVLKFKKLKHKQNTFYNLLSL